MLMVTSKANVQNIAKLSIFTNPLSLDLINKPPITDQSTIDFAEVKKGQDPSVRYFYWIANLLFYALLTIILCRCLIFPKIFFWVLFFTWEARWPHGQCARLRSGWSGFKLWPGTMSCVLGQNTLLSQCL